MPERFPASPRVAALPDAAASSARPNRVGLRRVANQAGDASANIGRPDIFPLRRAGRGRELLFHPRTFGDEFADTRLPQRPRCPGLKPDTASLMIPRDVAEFSPELILP